MNTVDISVEGLLNPRWLHTAELFCLRVLEELQLDNWELSIVFCNNEFIQELNHRFRGRNQATDVLSFSQWEGEPFPSSPKGEKTVGDVVISLEMVNRNQATTDESWETELKRLIIHGILHLAGYDHPETTGEGEMIDLQDRLLQSLKTESIIV